MKLTKKLETAILKTYNSYWENYLNGDVEAMHPLLADEYTQVGSAEGEVFSNKKDAVQFLYDTIDQVAGKLEMRNRKTTLEQQENAILIHEFCDLFALANGNWIFYSKFRASSFLQQKKDEWKFTHQHSSFPDTKAEDGQNIAIDKIAEENLQLREAVKRRTIELEQKNRELEIETALEKVRAVAMGMKKADDMLRICKTISLQLAQLGVKEIRNVQTAIFYESRGTYMNYEYYAKHDKTFITEVDYKNHKIQLAFAKKMLKGPNEEMQEHLRGKKLQDWYTYQKSTNQFADKYLLKAHSVNYYWFSLGPVALGISTYYPLTNDETNLFKRFLKVFALAYRRYLDIEQATAQAKEAQIEAALERVRARALAMHQSEEFTEVAKVMREQMGYLGQPELETSAVHLYNEDADHIFSWRAFRLSSKLKGNISYGFFKIPKTSCAVAKEFVQKFKSKATDYTIEVSGAKQTAWYKILFILAPEVADAMKKSGTTKEKRYYHFSKFTGGALLMVTSKEPAADTMELQKRSAQVFDLAYRRFKDLQKAEAQAKDAQIEAALERIRAASLAMMDSSALSGIIYKLYGELTKLDAQLDRCFIMIVNPENKGITWWMSGQEGLLAENGFFVQMNQHHSHLMYLDYCKKRKKKWTYLFEGKEKRNWDRFGFGETELVKLPEPIKEFMAAAKKVNLSGSSDQFGSLVTGSFEPLPEEQQDIISRFTIVFNQAYIRFLDLQNAEAQAREAQIETALEKVRSRTMAMHNSQELNEVALELRKQMGLLGQKDLEVCAIHLYDDEHSFESWSAMKAPGKESEILQTQARFPNKGIKIVDELMKYKKRGSKDYVLVNEGEKSVEWLHVMKKHAPQLHASIIQSIGKLPLKKLKSNWSVSDFSGGALIMVTYGEPDAASRNLLRRTANVFEQAYIRFLDLQKAEAQAREAQIETALERVRSRSMAMHKSEDLRSVVNTLYGEFKSLNVDFHVAIIRLLIDDSLDLHLWISTADGLYDDIIHWPYIDLPIFHVFHDARIAGKMVAYTMSEIETKEFFEEYFKLDAVPKERRSATQNVKLIDITGALQKFTGIFLMRYTEGAYSLYEKDIVNRFSKAFEQTYTRFLDLQKAEAQARESQIQLALERVRARTMAMQTSEDLKDAAALLFQQVKALGAPAYSCGYNIWEQGEKECDSWMSTHDGSGINPALKIPLTEDANFIHFVESKKNDDSFYVLEMRGERMQEHYQYLIKTIPVFKAYFEESVKAGFSMPEAQIHHLANFSYGNLMFITLEPCPEFHDVFKRFAAVFEQTYTRFLDLKKAEEQLREATIEAALEKIRSRSLAMHKSDELNEVLTILFQKLKELQIPVTAASIGLYIDGSKDMNVYVCGENVDGLVISNYRFPHFNNKISNDFSNAREKKFEFLSHTYTKEEKNAFYEYLFEHTSIMQVPDDIRRMIFESPAYTISMAPVNYSIFAVNDFEGKVLAKNEVDIIKRFAKVFDQTYTRFLDLQKAELQTHQAKIETALEKVRARALAMQQPEELTEVAQVMRYEMGLLGVEELETSSIYIHEEASENAECWYAIKDIRVPEKKLVSDHFKLNLHDTWVGRQMFEFYHSKEKQISIPMQGANRKEWIDYCSKQSKLLDGFYGQVIPDRTYHLHKFSNGTIGAATPGNISAESWDLLQRAASVFSLAYSRFKDLTQARIDLQKLKEEKQRAEEALTELQATQKQLIQSEKMASLGELTAGIAHEIQNPLNFVNNFSEVSTELVDEMNEELNKGNIDEAKEIANDLKQNLGKINHHGKRAGDIVKGMLQHSRSTNNATKEPTDINALADEYLRLAYHGLRAKDKDFNATMKTDYDETIGNINIIPQDIGRVILNLITNAFYVVNEKNKACQAARPDSFGKLVEASYEPIISINTKKVIDKVEIIVSDNGQGISQKILDKIFQPFFTTKPTGQGTGLGLSLSYDIVKAHGGELRVETKQGEGSTFIIQLPINTNNG